MPILPVLDVMRGQVVRGIAGRRDEYRPMVSRLTRSTEPLEMIQALHEHFGFREVYVADLDAIAEDAPPSDFVWDACALGIHVWLDRGMRTAQDFLGLFGYGSATEIAALETVPGPHLLRDLVGKWGPRVAFSLDMRDGRPLGDLTPWGSDQPLAIAERVIATGVRRLVLLDLASVGVGAGPSTGALCARLRREHPECELSTGGGVRGPDDVRALYAAGADYVLVASALHDGRLSAADVAALSAGHG